MPLLLLCASACVRFPVAAQSNAAVEATTVQTAGPAAAAYDQSGNLYLALQGDHVVRKVDVFGLITTVAGTGEQGFAGDGGAATSAQLDSPSGVAVDSTGAIYIADTRNHRIRKVSGGTITTVAGTGVAGFSGDGSVATAAQLNAPAGLSLDANGNLYIADSGNQRVRTLTNGVIATVAGNGEQGFAGDGGAATSASLDTPTGVAVDPSVSGRFYIADRHNQQVRAVAASGIISSVTGNSQNPNSPPLMLANPRAVAVAAAGTLYVTDTGNQRVLQLTNATTTVVAGTGEQGFSGDIAIPSSAVLDTPAGLAINPVGVLTFTDLHNQRTRSIANNAINTVAGIPPVNTEGLLLNGPIGGIYGTDPGSLTALFSNVGNTGTGTATLYQDGSVFATQALSSNRASFSLAGLAGGLHTFAVAYGGDSSNAAAASGVYLVNVAPAPQTVSFPGLQNPVTFSPGLTATLAATASSGLPITYTATGPATVSGSTLTYTGSGSVVVTATQAGNLNYATASSQQTVTVVASPLVLSSLAPATATLGTSNLLVTVTGSGFTRTSVVQASGATLATTYVNTTTLTATLPQLLNPGTLNLSVFDPATTFRSGNAAFTVTAPPASAQLTAPATSKSAQQPAVAFQLQAGYPVALNGVLTLSFTPDSGLGVDDPNIQFSTGGRTISFTVPANSTTVPAVAFQTGTVAGVINVTLSLTAAGVDVTPTNARVATVTVARQSPIAAVSFTQTGSILTVVVSGYSNSRDMTQANFTFTPTPGTDLATKSISLPVSSLFAPFYSSQASAAQGSVFTYTQTFDLSDGSSTVQSVGVDLTNSVGTSSATSTP